MFVSTPVIISTEEKNAVDQVLDWLNKNGSQFPEKAVSFKITRKKYSSADGNMHRRLYMYDAAGQRIIEQELPFNPEDPGTHSCKAFKKNNEWETVFHDKKGSRQSLRTSFFKSVCTYDGKQGLMKQAKHFLPDATEVQKQFEQLSGVMSKQPFSYHLGNVIEQTKTSDLKTTHYMLDAGDDLITILEENHLPEKIRLKLTLLCLKALAQLHAKNIIHADIKAENICLGKDGKTLSIIDYDFSFRSDTPTDLRMSTGTVGYLPPEYFKNNKHPSNFEVNRFSENKALKDAIFLELKPDFSAYVSKSSDVYSMGRILQSLIIHDRCYQRLILKMLSENPLARPDITDWAEMTLQQIHQTILTRYQPAQRRDTPTPPPPPKRQKPNHPEIAPNSFFNTAGTARKDGITLDLRERMAMASSTVSSR